MDTLVIMYSEVTFVVIDFSIGIIFTKVVQCMIVVINI